MPSATSVNRSRFQCARHRSRTIGGIAVGLSRRVPQRPGQHVEQQRAEQQQRQPDVGRAEEAPSGSASSLSRRTEESTASQPMRAAVPDHQGIGAAIHRAQSKEGRCARRPEITAIRV